MVDEVDIEIAKQANVDRLAAFTNLEWIDRFARAYGQKPSDVIMEKFDDVIPFLALWKEQLDFTNRFKKIKGDLNDTRPGS